MSEISDARPTAWVCAWNAIQAVQELKKPPKGTRVAREPLDELYWATLAEAAVFAQLASADTSTGISAGTLLSQVEAAKQHALDTLRDILGNRRPPDDICATCHAHHDKHSNDDLSCPAYTTEDGSIVFSTTHRYTEPRR
jgi:hypothetical protein